MKETIKDLIPKFEGMEKIEQSKDEDTFAAYCHSQLSGGIGMKIRNEYGLWVDTSPLRKYFDDNHPNLKHPDDMSDFIIRIIYNKLMPNDK